MIPLRLPATAEADTAFVARLHGGKAEPVNFDLDAIQIGNDGEHVAFAHRKGLFTVNTRGEDLDGDIVIVDPDRHSIDRVIRAGSRHNTLLVTEQCDQLCVMCSQPPKKTHDDRYAHFLEACLAAPEGMTIGISGGEPTLHRRNLFSLLETVLRERDDLAFHVLSNGQHFEPSDIEFLAQPAFRRVVWGIPLYSSDVQTHDRVVAKEGAFARLHESFATLLAAGSRIELRTVLTTATAPGLSALAEHLSKRLRFVEVWSIMQLESIGFAKNRWDDLYYDHADEFAPIQDAIAISQLNGHHVRLFNFPQCTIPENLRHLAPASISDWKRKFADACAHCSAKSDCSGFFEWHPHADVLTKVRPL